MLVFWCEDTAINHLLGKDCGVLLLWVALDAFKEVKDMNKWRLLEALWSCCSDT